MRLWRIAQRRHALDKVCAGTALYGGRCSPVGMPALILNPCNPDYAKLVLSIVRPFTFDGRMFK